MRALTEEIRVIRPAAVLDTRTAALVISELTRLDVAQGGIWNATSSLWQRYDSPWDGIGGSRGGSPAARLDRRDVRRPAPRTRSPSTR